MNEKLLDKLKHGKMGLEPEMPPPAERPVNRKPADPKAPVEQTGESGDDDKTIVSVEEATLGYGRTKVLTDINLKIVEGDFWCLIGPNGEGKTTLIKGLLGALRPSRGKIFLRADFAKRTRIGFVPQHCELNPSVPTTVREFVFSGLAGMRLDRQTCRSRLTQVMEVMGISRLALRDFWALSGGQRQRAMVARALIRDPLLVIVDEPTAGLDWAAAAGLLQTITELNRDRNITVVFVTHDLNLAGQRASHAALFRNRQVRSGPIREIFKPELLKATFGVPIQVTQQSDGRLGVRAESFSE